MKYPTRFETLSDLAKLPWFGLREGRLVVEDVSIPRAVDMHTHLAMRFAAQKPVDLHRASANTSHYLPHDRPVDFEVYINRNLLDPDLRALESDLGLGGFREGGPRVTHTIPNLEREMGELRVATSVLLAIDWPALSDNARTWLRAIHGRDALVGFGSVHPWTAHMEAKLDAQVELGARGIKLHPAAQLVRPDDSRAMKLYRLCGARGLPVLFHCGPVDIEPLLGRYLSQLRWYERAVAENPDTVFVLGHSGAMQMEEALRLAQTYPNVWLESSSQSLSNLRRILDQGPTERVVYGSDWPFYHQAIALAKVYMATDHDEKLRRAVLHDNAARLLGLDAQP